MSLFDVHPVVGESAAELCEKADLAYDMRAKELTDEKVAQLNQIIERDYTTEGNLRRRILQNVQRLKDIRSYRGLRHIRDLPVRGQHTRTNARTRKGPKKTVARKKGVKGR